MALYLIFMLHKHSLVNYGYRVREPILVGSIESRLKRYEAYRLLRWRTKSRPFHYFGLNTHENAWWHIFYVKYRPKHIRIAARVSQDDCCSGNITFKCVLEGPRFLKDQHSMYHLVTRVIARKGPFESEIPASASTLTARSWCGAFAAFSNAKRLTK